MGLGFRVSGLEFRERLVSPRRTRSAHHLCFKFTVLDLGFKVLGTGVRVSGFRFRI